MGTKPTTSTLTKCNLITHHPQPRVPCQAPVNPRFEHVVHVLGRWLLVGNCPGSSAKSGLWPRQRPESQFFQRKFAYRPPLRGGTWAPSRGTWAVTAHDHKPAQNCVCGVSARTPALDIWRRSVALIMDERSVTANPGQSVQPQLWFINPPALQQTAGRLRRIDRHWRLRVPHRHGRAQSRPSALRRRGVDGRDTPGHDGKRRSMRLNQPAVCCSADSIRREPRAGPDSRQANGAV